MSNKAELKEAAEATIMMIENYLELLEHLPESPSAENVRQAYEYDRLAFDTISDGLVQATTFLALCLQFGDESFNLDEFGPSQDDDRLLN